MLVENRNCVLYANMTNGLDLAIPLGLSCKVCRIQSTLLESKSYNRMINDLDYEMLMDMAKGMSIYVMDCKSHKCAPTRAIWQGIPFISFAIKKRWFDLQDDYKCIVKGMNITKYANELYKIIDFRKVDYFKSAVDKDNQFSIEGIYANTNRDSDRSLLSEYNIVGKSPYYTQEEIDLIKRMVGIRNA